MNDLFGKGIFTTDGDEWKAHRALTRPFFGTDRCLCSGSFPDMLIPIILPARERVRDFDLFDRYSEKVINVFRDRALAGESVDVQDIFGRFTLGRLSLKRNFGSSSYNILLKTLPASSCLAPLPSTPWTSHLPELALQNWGPKAPSRRVTTEALSARSRRFRLLLLNVVIARTHFGHCTSFGRTKPKSTIKLLTSGLSR